MAKFLGLQYPLRQTPLGIMAESNGVAQVKADLLQLLLTNPGERVMLPSFGTPLDRLLFEPNDDVLAAQAKQMIIDSITKWEPRIVVEDIVVSRVNNSNLLHILDTQEEINSILSISIKFVDPDNIQDVQELYLEVPIGGA